VLSKKPVGLLSQAKVECPFYFISRTYLLRSPSKYLVEHSRGSEFFIRSSSRSKLQIRSGIKIADGYVAFNRLPASFGGAMQCVLPARLTAGSQKGMYGLNVRTKGGIG
jgi:hypothetical protein